MKKAVSVILCFVLIFSTVIPVFAEGTRKCSCGFNPVIYVGPLGCSDIVRNPGEEDEQVLWKTDTGFLILNLLKKLPGLITGAVLGNYDLLGDSLIGFVNETFGDLALDENGNSKENVYTPSLNYPDSAEHSAENQFYFDYDFRLDPYIHAERLHRCIGEIKRLTGHDKVQLKCSSMGGVVLAAYLDTYDTDDIETIICQCCPLWGTAVAGELFCGKFELNPKSVKQYALDAIPYLDSGVFVQGLLITLVNVLDIFGVFGMITGLGNRLADNLIDRVYDECLIPIFGSLPGIWSFVPREYYSDAVEFMGIDKNSGLYEKINHYRTAQANVADNLLNARSSGVKTYIFCGYNVQRTPLVSARLNTSDGTVDTKYASLGATCGNVKETLPESYLSSLSDTRYLSPDKMIDASTCVLRDCTWFNKGWLHCNGQSAINDFYRYLLTSKEQITVFTNEKYPQFLENNKNEQTLSPVK